MATAKTPTLTRKEREHRARQEEIMRAARELFATQGYHRTTLEDIARHAEFGKGTIYNYFKSKEDLFLGIIDELVTQVVSVAETSLVPSVGDARTQLAAYARRMFDLARTNSDTVRLVTQEIFHVDPARFASRLKALDAQRRHILTLLARPFTRESRARRIKSYDPQALAMLFDGMIKAYTMQVLLDSRSAPHSLGDDRASTMLIEVLFDGIAERKSKG
jgi:AcrR family transcriptional regulator